MTILKGELYKVNDLNHLLEKTDFDPWDVLEAVEADESLPQFPEGFFLDEADDLYEGEPWWEGPENTTLRDLTYDFAAEGIAAHCLNHTVGFIALLEQDHRDWVHLYDGNIHTVVEVFPEEDQ